MQVRTPGTGNIISVLVDAETYTLGSTVVGYGFNLHPTLNPKASVFFKSSTGGYGRGNLIFALDNASDWDKVTESDEVMRIDHDGNVGIGTSSPNATLHVNAMTGQDPFRIQIAGSSKLYTSTVFACQSLHCHRE